MGFLDHVRLWGDVLDPRLDEKAAPSLGGVHLGREEAIYVDSSEFFRRTLLTRHMLDALENIANALMGRGGNKVLMLLSLFGGGKTHTLLTIYHAFRNPRSILDAKSEDSGAGRDVKRLADEISRLGGVRIAVIDGFFSELAPTPINPYVDSKKGYRVQTLWGSLAHQLGRYDEVRDNDEKMLAPPASIVARLLGDEPVLILVDELADYVVRLKASNDQVLRNYADQVLSFVEHLVKAVDLSERAVLVVSLPVEERGGLVIEGRYAAARDIIESLYRSIGRVASRRVVPVSTPEIPRILRARMFEYVDERAAKAVSSTLAKIYSDYRDIFGEDAVKLANEAVDTYPFHPTYIATIVDVVDKHSGLQRTRDVIRITRKVIRKLSMEKSGSELVMPFHIDIEDRDIRASLLTQEYSQYETVVEEDISRRASAYEKPEIVKAVAKAIFVRTFTYLSTTKALQIYPDAHAVAVSSYEPSMARSHGSLPNEYLNALDWASKNMVYLLSEGGRYWFTYIASPIRMIEMNAGRIDDGSAMRVVEEYAKKLLTKPAEEVVSESRKYKPSMWIPFNPAMSMVLREPKPVDHDSREYILLVILKPVRDEDIEDILYRTSSGGTRKHANTIYLIYPGSSGNVSGMLSQAKKLIACDEVKEEIDTMYNGDIRDIMRKRLEKYCYGMEGVLGTLAVNILSGLDTVVYPDYDKDRNVNSFRKARANMADTILEIAARTLKNEKPPKLYEEIGFDVLNYILSQSGVDLSSSDKQRSVADILGFFYTNPRLPIVKEDEILSAIASGVKSLKIGVKSGGKLYFKKIHICKSVQECKPPSIDEGDAPQSIAPADTVLPWGLALQEQLDGLKDGEERVSGGVLRTWHAFYIDGNLVPIRDALKKYSLDVLKSSPIVRVSEFLEEGVDLKLDRYEVTATPGEEITINIVIERIGAFDGVVTLKTSYGDTNPQSLVIGSGTPSAISVWRIRAPDDPGTYVYEVNAEDSSGKVLRASRLKISVKPKKREVKGVPPKDVRISQIEIEVSEYNLKPLRILRIKFGSVANVEEASLGITVKAEGRSPSITLSMKDASLEDVDMIFTSVTNRYGVRGEMSYRVRLKPRSGSYIVAPEFTEDEANTLKNHMLYTVYEEEGGG